MLNKILLLNGQSHKGSTYHIGKLLLDNIGRENDVREYFLPNALNHFCLGCYSCIEDESRCPFYSDKRQIMSEIDQADLIIFTTPNYCMAPSAPMKSFMDLTFTYWMSHKPRACMFSKKAVVISTAAGSGTNYAIKPIKRTLSYWGVSYIKTYGICVQASNWNGVDPKKKLKIENDMKKLAKSLTANKKAKVTLKTKLMFTMFANMQKATWEAAQPKKIIGYSKVS